MESNMARQILAIALALLIGVPVGAWLVVRFMPRPNPYPVRTIEIVEV